MPYVCLFIYRCMYPKMCMFYYSEQEVTWGLSSGSTQTYNYRQKEGARRSADKRGGRENRERFRPKLDPIHLPLPFQRQQPELICDLFPCLTKPGGGESLRACSGENRMIRKTFLSLIWSAPNKKQKVGLRNHISSSQGSVSTSESLQLHTVLSAEENF